MRRLWPSLRHKGDTTSKLAIRDKAGEHRSGLWAQAYQSLTNDDPRLVAALDHLLTQGSQFHDGLSPSTQSSYGDATNPRALPNMEEQMSAMIESRLKIMDDRKWQLRMGEHSVQIRQQIDRITKIVTVAKDFISSAASMDPVHAGLPWAGICVLLPLLTNDSKQRSLAMDGLEYIAKLVRRCTEIERLYLRNDTFRLEEDLRKSLTAIYRLVLQYQARAACQFSRNTAHQAIRNIVIADGWDCILTSVKDHETSCEILLRIIDAEDSRSRADTLEALISEQNHRVTELLETHRQQDEASSKTLSGEVRRGVEYQAIEEASSCHESLRVSEYEFNKDKNPARIPGTCEWFLQHSRYRKWLETTTSAWLWVTGDPGCGKSVLSRHLVDSYMTRATASDEEDIVCYFFFKDDANSNRSATNALASIIHQIFVQDSSLLEHALPLYRANGTRLGQIFEPLWKIFHSVVTESPNRKITILLDALDECEEKTQNLLIPKFAELFSSPTRCFLKLLVTSRPSTAISDQIWHGKIDPTSIQLTGENDAEMEAISVEIDLVIREKIKQFHGLRRFRGIDDSAHEALSVRLLTVENRTYLWIALIFPELEKCAGFSEKKLVTVIQHLPKTVHDAYEGILSRSTDLKRARILLSIVLGARRPLTLDEMNVALAITHSSRSTDQLDLEPSSSFSTTLRDLCGLFVSIRDSKIYLIHQTAKDFLLRSEERNVDFSPSLWYSSLESEDCEYMMWRTCVTYLSFLDFEVNPFRSAGLPWGTLREATRQYLEQYAFLQYAVDFWADYYTTFWEDSEASSHDYERIMHICNPNTRIFESWFQIKWTMMESSKCHPRGLNEISLAAYLNSLSLYEASLQRGVRMDMLDNHSRSALWWALEKGHEEFATNLINEANHPVDVNSTLQMVALKDCSSVIHWLYKKGHDLRAKAKDGWTACQRAAVRGCRYSPFLIFGFDQEVKDHSLYEVVSSRDYLLLESWLYGHGQTGMEAKYSDNETLMYRCIANGWTDIAKTLLYFGADPNSVSHNRWNAAGYQHGETLLYRAASEVDKTMVHLLLERGAVVDAKSRMSETALYRTTCCTHGKADDQAQIAGLLLRSGADVNSRTENGDTPLQNVLRVGREPLRSLLKEAAGMLGLDGTMLLTAPERTETSEKAGKEEDALRLIEQSRLFDMENFNNLLGFDTEEEVPNMAFPGCATSNQAKNANGSIRYIKVYESCERLMAFKPADDDYDSRITEDQWADMTQELLTLEKVLEETKVALQRFYRTISATALTDSEDEE
ncbi:MAG: hypothetical protein LQ339_004561 [Xanthoria mediterranea]|nr:MAG: hypothetical protein LQ339_004561 [Xanthoria mediterranea]